MSAALPYGPVLSAAGTVMQMREVSEERASRAAETLQLAREHQKRADEAADDVERAEKVRLNHLYFRSMR